MKIFIRYSARADLPKGMEAFYSPVDPNDPDGAHMWDGFEPDTGGLAIANVAKLQQDIKRLTADKARADQFAAKYRKKDSTDTYTPEEIEQLVQIAAQHAEDRGKTVDLDKIRKEVAAEIKGQSDQQVKAVQAQLETERKSTGYYRDRYRDRIRMTEAAAALAGLRPKAGLSELALERFARELDLEEYDTEDGQKDFRTRVKGPNGHRINAKGEPIQPKEHAEGEFVRQYAELFEPRDRQSGTGLSDTRNGNNAGNNGAGAGKGSGRFVMKQTDMLADTGAYRKQLQSVPKTDFLHIIGADGKIVDVRPGMGA